MKKKSKKAEPPVETISAFLSIFWSEHVEALLNEKMTQTEDNGEHHHTVVYPVMVRGFVLDEDEQFIYLGDDIENKPTKALNRKNIVAIEIVEPEDQLDDMLSEMPTPTREEEFN